MKLYNWNERNSFFCFQQPEKLLITKTSVRTIVITAKKWELFASKVVQLMHDTRLYTQLTASFPLSLSPCHRARSVLFGTHRLAKIRWPAILRLYYTHLQNKNTRNELIMFCPQILILMWITSLRISHAFLKCFLASVILIKKESFFMQTCRENKIKN